MKLSTENTVEPASLQPGTFVRVRADHANVARAGKDGMVREDLGDIVALVFYFDRNCKPQGCYCFGPELMNKSELDMDSAEQ